jgi:hypothetical protein
MAEAGGVLVSCAYAPAAAAIANPVSNAAVATNGVLDFMI